MSHKPTVANSFTRMSTTRFGDKLKMSTGSKKNALKASASSFGLQNMTAQRLRNLNSSASGLVTSQPTNLRNFMKAPQPMTMMQRQPHITPYAMIGRGETTKLRAVKDSSEELSFTQKFKNLVYGGDDKKKYTEELIKNAKILSTPGRGILATDESNKTCGQRFEERGIENTEENRRRYREILYSTSGLCEFISGVIMYDETARQKAGDGRTFPELLQQKKNGILPGIKVDLGLTEIAGTDGETRCNGLDGLGMRTAEYYEMGCRFAKWRCVLKITEDGCPSDIAIKDTAYSLAMYARICQQNGLVPIVEPEILTDGKHDIQKCAAISEKVFSAVVDELFKQDVLFDGMLLKPNMIMEGAQCPSGKASAEEVALHTIRTLGKTIPPKVPGVTFLSGGQSEARACANLNAMNQVEDLPWTLSYSFGRALQIEALDIWAGKEENVEAA